MTDTDIIDDPSEEPIPDSEWAQRRLCPDGNCIGVIGSDGRCKECGRPGDDDQTGEAADDQGTLSATPSSDTSDPEAATPDASPSGFHEDVDDDHWANRRLCSDGNCIGVIGADGRCKECGRPDEDR